jgi:transposase
MDEPTAGLQSYFSKIHGDARVDNRRVLAVIVFVNRNALRWRHAPEDYGLHKTLYNQ